MAGPLSDKEFSSSDITPVASKVFSPLAASEPTKYDPTGQQYLYNDVPWRVRMGRLRPKAWRGETYIPDSPQTGGYVRQAMQSVFDD